MNNIKEQLRQAMIEIERLKRENEDLKSKLNLISTEIVTVDHRTLDINRDKTVATIRHSKTEGIHQFSTVEDKLELYRSCFRGREEVYPIRWQNKQGKSGYSPACGNEWTAVCQKPKVKCSVCLHQDFLPVTDQVISNHLDARADQTIGVYPMLKDETCWFLAIDFDKKNWQEDTAVVMRVCKERQIPAALERSRSGNGGHIWIFFSEPLSASLARKLGTTLLTLTMKQRYQLGLDSYDRLFPNQDTLPKGGFGNLIALPLQGGPRKSGNSVFVDEFFQPYEDQWQFLFGLGKLTEDEVISFLQKYDLESNFLQLGFLDSEGDEDRPWEAKGKALDISKREQLPDTVTLVISNRLYVSKKGLSPDMLNQLMRLASFANPDFYKTQALRLSTYGKPRVICCAEDLSNNMVLPRGCLQQVQAFFKHHDIELSISDERSEGSPIHTKFCGTLTTMQDTAARAIMAHDMGILAAATAFGKTVVASNIIANRQVNTLVLVHRRELMDQWKERLQTFLDLPKESIGIVGGGKDKRTGIVDIAVIQSLNHKGEVKDYIKDYGQIIVDECHHVSAFSFEQVLMQAKSKYVFGLTATPKRQDGQEAIMIMQLGPVRIRVDAKMQAVSRGFSLTVIPRYTQFQLPGGSETKGIQDIYQLLVTDEERNSKIFDDLLSCLDKGRSPLLLLERTAHVAYFEKRLEKFAKNIIVLRGGMGKKQREAIRQQIASIPDHEERVFIATGKLIGEGFDDARLDTLFLAHPISWKGTLQ
ncbi:TOTE conflict system archaeo-eukaryotic primase domain-containing protein [Paenibacillus eucommiae]|uniref:Superfamily II DNA or RNA helicase n=1 Tax=Paenibacillus eucommiae TaxID=1355755 RepID=A0ABS4IXD8_9BACL|nr:DEAD/DEAH box helicase family protein [Paenibacillus eucommiae]MBP1991765.1 superfamily II DNA or RNA helicase [Paenibacillus eucommiae]